MTEPTLICVYAALALLAFANGANDLSRAAASLLGSGASTFRRAQIIVLACTLLGSLLSLRLALGVARQFSSSLRTLDHTQLPLIVLAILLGASLWILVATWRGLPVATTHALLSGLLGVAFVGDGVQAIFGMDVGRRFILPLVASPLLAFVVVVLLRAFQHSIFPSLPVSQSRSMRIAHWCFSGLVATSRGVNDSAKIWGVAMPVAIAGVALPEQASISGSALQALLLTVALAMLLGGLLSGRRVTESVGYRITVLQHVDGLIASLASFLVIGSASILSFPVASSHVVGGAVMALAITNGERRANRALMSAMFLSWAVTLPMAALFSGILLLALQRLSLSASKSIPVSSLPLLPIFVALMIYCSQTLRVRFLPRRLFLIFVCNGNTSRSPMAAAICRHLASNRALKLGHVYVVSRGLNVELGTSLTYHGKRTLHDNGIFDTAHQAANLTDREAQRATHIFCMTQDQCDTVIARFASASGKTVPLHTTDIPNPAGATYESYQTLAGTLFNSIAARLQELSALSSPKLRKRCRT